MIARDHDESFLWIKAEILTEFFQIVADVVECLGGFISSPDTAKATIYQVAGNDQKIDFCFEAFQIN